jgi:hypothetical protein
MISIPFTPREVQATEWRLQQIYDAAALGLKGDKLALAAGMLPSEYRQLCQLDPVAEMAALKGAADGELEASTQLREAARNGDAKAALSILQHAHGWTAKQEISMSIETINIQSALDEARSRVMEKMVDDVPHAPSRTLTKDINGTTTNIPTRRRTNADGGVMVAKDSG